jgi:cell division protein ZapA (FtsZ GTPase activity inhibitor)
VISQVAVAVFKTLRKRIILCGGDPDYILKLAEYVDSMMRAVADETHTANSEQLAVLTAVRIANELLKTKLEGEEKKTSGKEETTEETDSFDPLVGEVGQPRKPFTEEDRQRTRERRQRHQTRRWFVRQLLAVAEGQVGHVEQRAQGAPCLWQGQRLESARAG